MHRILTGVIVLAWLPTLVAQPITKSREVASTPGQISQLRVSPDGSLLALSTVRIKVDAAGRRVGDGNEILVLDQTTGKVQLRTGRTDAMLLGFTSNGKFLALGRRSGLEGTAIELWDMDTKKESTTKAFGKEYGWPVLSADGAKVTTLTGHREAVSHTVATWDILTGNQFESFTFDEGKTLSFQQIEKGPFLAIVENQKGLELRTRNPKGGKISKASLPGVSTATISQDGKWVLGHTNQGLRLFDGTGKLKWTVTKNYLPYSFGVAGKNVIALSPDGNGFLHDIANGKVTKTINVGLAEAGGWAINSQGKTLYLYGGKEKRGADWAIHAITLSK